MTLTISAAQVASFIANPSSFSGYSAGSHVIISGAISHTQATSLNAVDATYLQATVSETTLANLTAISVDNSSRSSLNKFSFVISDTGATAAELSALQAKTSIAVDADNIGATATGIEASSSSDITSLYTGTVVPTGIADAKISVNDTTIDATTLNTINGYTTGDVTVTALTISGLVADIETALGASGSGIVYSQTLAGAGALKVTVSDTTVDAANLVDVDGLTAGVVTVSTSATSITGIIGEVQSAFTAAQAGTIAGLGALNITLDDSSTTDVESYGIAAIHTLIDTLTGYTGKVTATVSTNDATTLAGGTGVTGTGHSLTITMSDAGATAAELNTIAAATVIPVILDSDGLSGDAITTIESSAYADVLALFQNASGFTGLSANPVTVSDGITVAQANALDALTTGAITATISDQALSTLGGLTGTGNAYTTVIDDTSAAAADLNALIAKTSVAINATATGTITGSLADLNTLYVTNTGWTGQGAENLTVSDTAIDAALLTAVNAGTSGLITLSSSVASISGAGSQIEALYDANTGAGHLTGLDGDLTVTVTGDSGTPTVIDADHLIAIDGDTTGLITIDSSAASVTGTYANVHTVLTSNKLAAGVLTVDSPSAADASRTAGTYTIGASDYTSQGSGTGATFTVTVLANGSATAAVTSAGTGYAVDNTFTVTDAKLGGGGAASFTFDVASIDDTGVATPTISGLDNLAVNLSDTNLALASYLDIQNNYTTGVITADITASAKSAILAETVSGTNDIVNGNNLSLDVTDATFTTAELTEINALTTGTVELTGGGSAVTITGTVSELNTIFAAKVSAGSDGFLDTGLADAAATITDTGNVLASELKAISAATSGTVNIDTATTITGLLADINSVLADAQISNKGDQIVTVTDATVSASALATLLVNDAGLSSNNVIITASSMTGSEAEVSLIIDDAVDGAAGGLVAAHGVDNAGKSVTGLEAINITLSGTPTAAQIQAIAARTTGTITATTSGTAAAIAAGLTETIADTGGHNLTVNIADTTVAAADLNTISGLTTGAITLDTDSGTAGNQSPTITGTKTAIASVLDDSGITGSSASALIVSGGISVSELTALKAKTTGAITGTVSDGDMATLAGITGTDNAVAIAITDSTISATALDALDAKTTGLINVAATSTLTGTLAEVTSTLARTATVNGIGAIKVSVSDTSITVAEAVALDALTSGAITATISETDMDALLGSSIATVDSIGAAAGARVAGTYTISASDYTAQGSGENATFSIVVDSSGAATVTVTNPGTGYAVDNTFTVTDAKLGGGGAASLTFDVATITSGLGTGNSWITTVASQSPENSSATGTQLDTVVSAANLATLDGLTDQVVTVTAPTVDGTLAQIAAVITANSPADLSTRTITGVETKALTVTDASITQAEAETAQAYSTGVLTATVASDDILRIDTISAHNDSKVPGFYTVTDTGGALSSGNGSGAVLTVMVSDTGIKTVDTLAGTDATSTPGTYIIDSGNSTQETGTNAKFSIVVPDGGTILLAGITVLEGGTAFADGKTITIANSVFGGTGGGNLTFDAATLGAGSVSVTAITNPGTGYAVGDTFTLPTDLAGTVNADGSGGTTALTHATTFKVASLGKVSIADFIATTTSNGVTTNNVQSGNALSVVFDDAAYSAADLVTANSLTSGLITLTPTTGANGSTTAAIPTLTGTTADLVSVYAAAATTGDGILTSSYSASPLTIQEPITFGGLVSAASLKTLDEATTGLVTVDVAWDADGLDSDDETTITGITGSYADVHYVFTQDSSDGTHGVGTPTITGIEAAATTVTLTGTSTVAQVNDIVNNYTSGVVTATISEGDMTTLATLTTTVGAYTVNITDTTVAAAALNTLDGDTTAAITLATGTTLTGALANNGAVDTALSSTGITGIGSVAVTSADATNTVAEANDISSQTTGVVTATLATGALTTFAGLNETGNAFTINVSDTGTVDAATVNVLNGKTTGVVTLAATGVSGSLSDIKSLYEANTASEVAGLGNEIVTISDTGSVSAADLNTVNGLTTGVITAIGVTTVSGTLAEIKTAYAAGSAGTLSGLGNEAITVTDTGVITSTDLSDLDALTTGAVTVSLSGASVAATTLNSLDSSSTQVVSASSVTTLTGTAADINTAYASSGISGLGDEAVTISDTSIAAATLNTLNGNTTGTVNASTVTTVTGTAADANTMYATAGISGGGDEAVTITDTSIAASVLNTLDGNTTGSVNASSLTTITGSGTDAQTAFDSAGISGLTFDASSYLASYGDLLAAFGSDLTLSRTHYFAFGVSEGRSFDSFDDSSYLASHSDLLAAFGTNTDSALVHYINFGYSEGRSVDSFDENSYLASNSSLIGTTTDAAAHYVSTGYAAGLALDTFDELSYIASHSDLISAFGTDGAAGTKHFVDFGSAEGRTDTFDELGYIASHTDLIAAYGTDTSSAAVHYISYGSTEGRTVTFDASSYLAAHADLRASFGTDQELATKHYIEFGSAEGRALT